MITIIVHIRNEEAFECEIDELPNTSNQFIQVHNPRRRDGKDLHYLHEEVTSMLVPWHRINFVQILPSGEVEEVASFIR
jgi:hypothetical protein